MVIRTKRDRLEEFVAGLGSVAVAFSGGADSTLLLAVCVHVLGAEHVVAVTADSPTLPRSELADTTALAQELGARQLIIATEELHDEGFASNSPDRCFYCKQELFTRIRDLARDEGFEHTVYGATAADLGDHRPGMRAAKRAGALAPLLEAGFSKQEVRDLSRELGLRTWDKPAMACLSSRLPYGTRVTEKKLLQVEQAEDLLRDRMGFTEVRVRHHDSIARIEIQPQEFPRLLENETREQILSEFKRLGFGYITVDLQGFRSGSMNETLGQPAVRSTEDGW